MENKNQKSLSITALLFSILPLATFIPFFLKVTLSDNVRTIWSIANVVSVLLGLILSSACVRISEKWSAVNVISVAISVFWVLLIIGMFALALLLNILN